MTPEDLAARHPRLLHLTDPRNLPGIAARGLLSAARLAAAFAAAGRDVSAIGRRRAAAVVLDHPELGVAVVNDNGPLREAKLAACLDDGLTPADWLAMLNARVFFWTSAGSARALALARAWRDRPRVLLVLDTRRLVAAHHARVEIAPINTGSTIRRPARRGLATFAPVAGLDLADWRRRRGQGDRIRELVVREAVPDAMAFVISVFRGTGAEIARALPPGW